MDEYKQSPRLHSIRLELALALISIEGNILCGFNINMNGWIGSEVLYMCPPLLVAT